MQFSVDPFFAGLVSDSYARFLGRPLIPPGYNDEMGARWLYEEANFCLLAHNTEANPRFIYANIAAQLRFEYTWDEFMSLPSQLSAEAANREERQRLLEDVSRRGFATGYSGVRTSKSGRRFWINDVTVWQIIDPQGELHGQAAMIPTTQDV